MNDYIRLPQSALDMVKNKDLWQLYGYILSKADENGQWIVSLKDLNMDLGLTRQRFRTLFKSLKSTACITARITTNSTIVTLSVSRSNSKTSAAKSTAKSTALTTTKPTAETNAIEDWFGQFVEYFNNGFAGTAIPKITKLTDRRKTAIKNIFKEYGKETVNAVLRKVYASDFLCGRETRWHASFDWIFNKTNFQKILEDTYVNRADSTQWQQSSGRGQHRNPTLDDLAREIYGDTSL